MTRSRVALSLITPLLTMTDFGHLLHHVAKGKRLSQVQDLWIFTDPVEYPGIDQVFPMYPEQVFFLAELDRAKLPGAHVLEIGLGSGLLSIITILVR